jgi:hypothetical protein
VRRARGKVLVAMEVREGRVTTAEGNWRKRRGASSRVNGGGGRRRGRWW